MKISSLCLFSALSTTPAMAQIAAPNLALLRAPKMATVTVFAQGFQEPTGIARDQVGHFFVSDFKAGEVVMLSLKGAKLATLAKGLNGPSQVVARKYATSDVFVAERAAHRIIEVTRDGETKVLGEAIESPMALTDRSGFDDLIVLSTATSKVFGYAPILRTGQFKGDIWSLPHTWIEISPAPAGETRPPFRALAGDNQQIFLSGESDGTVWRLLRDGKLAAYATNLGAPSGLAMAKDGSLFVCDESNGGRLLKLDSNGEPTVLAEKLGHPNSILFLGAKTLLVSNRDGNIWKIALP